MRPLWERAGVTHWTKALAQLLDGGTLPHSLLLYGEAGSGKRAMALGLAEEWLGRPVFRTIPEEPAPLWRERDDMFWLRPETTSLRIGQWQMLLQEYLSHKVEGRRVVLIEELQTARPDFLNALLKTIEEPPEGLLFLLLTTRKGDVLPTIISRCMRIPCVQVPSSEQPTTIPASYAQALSFMEILSRPRGVFTEAVLLLHALDKQQLAFFLAAARWVLRDCAALRLGAARSRLSMPLAETQLLNLATRWPGRSVPHLVTALDRAEEALQLSIRPALIVDALIVAWRKALKESL